MSKASELLSLVGFVPAKSNKSPFPRYLPEGMTHEENKVSFNSHLLSNPIVSAVYHDALVEANNDPTLQVTKGLNEANWFIDVIPETLRAHIRNVEIPSLHEFENNLRKDVKDRWDSHTGTINRRPASAETKF